MLFEGNRVQDPDCGLSLPERYLRVPLKGYYTGSLKGLIRGTVPYLGADGSVVTWGNDAYGGDSSAVQSQLKNVQQISACRHGAFAAILDDGSVVQCTGFAQAYRRHGLEAKKPSYHDQKKANHTGLRDMTRRTIPEENPSCSGWTEDT